jgi:hypothetical protein
MVTALRKALIDENLNSAGAGPGGNTTSPRKAAAASVPSPPPQAGKGDELKTEPAEPVMLCFISPPLYHSPHLCQAPQTPQPPTIDNKFDRIIADSATGRINNLIKRIPVIAGYSFQWLKSQIIRSIKTHLRIALCVDIPRAVEYTIPTEAQRILDFGDKFDTRSNDLNAKLGNLTNQTMSASSRTLKRFTLLSKSALYQQAYGGVKRGGGGGPSASRALDPSSGADGSKGPGGDWTSSETLNSVSDEINPSDVNIFTCPILGGTIQYSCVPVWWDAQREEAALGICNALLSPNKTSNFGSYNRISTPIDVLIPFQSGLLGADGVPIHISISAHIIERNFMKTLSDISSLGIFGTFSPVNIFEDADVSSLTSTSCGSSGSRPTTPSPRSHRSITGRKLSRLAATEKQSSEMPHLLTNQSALRDEVNDYVDRMLLESQALLATLLSHPLPSDTLLLSQPVLCLSPERESEIACMTLRSILEAGLRMLIQRKQHLTDALLLETDALIVLNSLVPVRECLEQSQKDIMNGMRIISKKLSAIKSEIITFSTQTVDSLDFKHQQEQLWMLQEDINGCEAQVYDQYLYHEENTNYNRTLIKSILAKDWIDFSKLLIGKGTKKKVILTMAGLLMIVGQLGSSTASGGGGYEDAGHISKLSQNVLKSMEFVNAVSNFKPMNLSSVQYSQLCEINQLIRHECAVAEDDESDDDEETDATTATDSNLDRASSSTIHLTTPTLVNTSTARRYDLLSTSFIENQTTEQKIILFLMKLQEIFEFNSRMDLFKSQKAIQKSELQREQALIWDQRNSQLKVLEEEHRLIEGDLHALDAAFISNKEKLFRIATLQSAQVPQTSAQGGTATGAEGGEGDEASSSASSALFPAIKESVNYLKKEIEQIDHILDHIVADSCVAATILVRVGWLPDQIRQESLDSLRNYLKSETTFNPTDSPYVLGCLLDRLQIRQWTCYLKNGLIRDPPSINSMSLLYLSPAYTFLIDPDGIAENALLPLVEVECVLYHVTGVAFNLEALENIIQRGNLVDETKVTILVTDLQAGASPDLIAFLSSDIDTFDHHDHGPSGYATIAHRALRCTFNSQQSLDQHKSLVLLPRVRVILISTEPPTLNHEGLGRPLPPSCFKNMTIVHWVSSVTNSFYIDSKPLASVMNKSHSGTSLVETFIMDIVHEKVSPITKLNLINSRVIDYTMELYLAESAAYNATLSWAQKKQNLMHRHSNSDNRTHRNSDSSLSNSALSARLAQYLTQPLLDLSFLESEECCRVFVESHHKRVLLSKSFINIEKLERDCLMYHKVFLDACTMSAHFIRMCRLLIPPSDFPPYALNVVTICAKAIRPFLSSPRFRKFSRSIPESMQNLKRFNKGIKLFQTEVRKRIRKAATGGRSGDAALSFISSSALPLSVAASPSSQIWKPKKTSISSPGGSSADSPGRRLSLVLRANQISEFIHISMTERERLMADLAVLVQPLRTKLLQVVFDYIHLQVHPGKEWLVKLSLTLCAWSQASSPPAEELRTFINFINHRSDLQTTFYSVNSSEKKEEPLTFSSSSSSRGTSASGMGSEANGQDRKSLLKRNSSVRKSTHFSSNSFTNIDISNRPETFWVKENTGPVIASRSTAVTISQAVEKAEWMIRGDGVLDGVWINQHSLRWRISYLPPRQEVKRGVDGVVIARPTSYWNPVFCDATTPQLVTKNAIFQAIARGEDLFLLEWMRLLGMKPHHDFYSKSLIKGGGQNKLSTTVLTVLHKTKLAKQTAVAGMKKRASGTKRLTNIASQQQQQQVSSQSQSRLSTISQNPSSSTQLRKSIRSRTIRKQSVIFHTPPVVASLSGDLSLSQEFSKQQEQKTQEEQLSRQAEMFSSALRKPPTTLAIKPQASNTGFHVSAPAVPAAASLPAAAPELKKTASNSFYNEQKNLNKLLTSSESRNNFKLLEKHSTLCSVFQGMSVGIGQYLEEFIEWKSFLESLSGKNFRNLSTRELVYLVAKLVPPQLEGGGDEDQEGPSQGLWASGKELSVLQTFLLVYAIAPSACEAVANIYFSLCLVYLQQGNVLLKHVDEIWENEEKSDSEDEEEDDEEEDEEGEQDDGETGHRKMKFQGIKEEDEEDEDEEGEEGRDVMKMQDLLSSSLVEEPSLDTLTSSLSLTRRDDAGRFQDGIFELNCWTKLKRIAAGTEVGRRVTQHTTRGRVQLTCRDYENWELVLMSVYKKFPDENKSALMKSLRDSFDGVGPLFLATQHPHHHMARITQRACEYALNNCGGSTGQVVVTNCRIDELDGFYQSGDVSKQNVKLLTMKMKSVREKVGILTRPVGNLQDIALKNSYAVEMIDLSSSFGNALIESAYRRLPYDLLTLGNQPRDQDRKKSSIENNAHIAFSPAKRSSAASLSVNGLDTESLGGGGSTTTLSPRPVLRLPSVVSAEWNYLQSYQKGRYGYEVTRSYGTAPFLFVGLLPTHWLHQHTLQEIIGCSTPSSSAASASPSSPHKGSNKPKPAATSSSSSTLLSSHENHCISPIISRGVILDELEGSVLSVMQSLKKSARTKLNKAICEKLRYSTKLEIMVTSAVHILWKISISLQCKLDSESSVGGGAAWSVCMETLSLWQTARLVLKVSDLLQLSRWEHIFRGKMTSCRQQSASQLASEIRNDPSFCRLIWLLIESFCRISFDGCGRGGEGGIDEGGGGEEKGGKESSSSSPRKRTRLSILIRQESLQGKNPEDFLSNYREVMSKSPTKFRSALADPIPGPASAPPQGPGQVPRRPIKEKPSVLRRRKREKERSEAAAALASNAHRVSFESLSSLTLHTLGPNRRSFVSTELRNRVAAAVSVYLSHVIASQKITSSSSSQLRGTGAGSGATTAAGGGKKGRMTSMNPFSTPNQSHSNQPASGPPLSEQLYPATLSSPSALRTPGSPLRATPGGGVGAAGGQWVDPGERWPVVDPKHCENITIGSLQWNEILSTLLLWTRSDLLMGVETTELDIARRRTSYAKLRSSFLQWAKSDLFFPQQQQQQQQQGRYGSYSDSASIGSRKSSTQS